MTVLYITYDGLLDPLGSSQILPYVKGISVHQDKVVIVSFEKAERLLRDKDPCVHLRREKIHGVVDWYDHDLFVRHSVHPSRNHSFCEELHSRDSFSLRDH